MARKKTNEIFTSIEVIDAGAKGKSIAKAPDGKVIFLTNAIPGDVVDIQTTKKRKAYYEGQAITFHKLSDKRTQPVCTHFGLCGGCKWQHMKYEDQLFYKQNEVKQNLERIGHLDIKEYIPILGSEKQYMYRNKMEFSFSDSRWLTHEEIADTDTQIDRRACGFHKPGMWDKIIDITECHLQEDPSNAIRNGVKQFAIENEISFFNPRQQTGLLRTMMVRTSSTGAIMVVIQFTENDTVKIKLVLDYLAANFSQINSLQYVINSKGNDSIYDQDVSLYKGENHIFEEMEGLKFSINAKSFYQTNSAQAYQLYKVTRQFAGLTGKELVYDLYTGTGTIALFVSKLAKHVVGIESVPEAILDAQKNAKENNITNTSFFVGDMAKIFTDDFIAKNGKPDVIITDPPRDGMHKNVVNQLLKILPQKIVYVSCNSATQARDVSLLKEHYTVSISQAVDMFPQTHHVENVVLLELK
ncbi:MAG: 23S rRNA (uracil(1939)-C(5))-methyltransferase RlmD [Flavobacteriales bacterium]|jgi:23S rRNA (uracil1939-C5)-methyltransferase|nr:23S rRNA (uracil(1939)-C(5))-methyltransferase RlmD [Flavobacteriales bacterium]